MNFRYIPFDNRFKGQTHIHSTMSDGGKSYSEIAELYSECGYDFVFITDHRYYGDVASSSTSDILLIDGLEIDGSDRDGAYYHIVGLDFNRPFDPQLPLERGIGLLQDEGAFIILAHPHWSGNTPAEALKYPFDGVEVYNNVCHVMNGKSIGLSHWDTMLEQGSSALAFASDDAHIRPAHPSYNGGWIKVNARDLDKKSIMKSIREGQFYASTGPDFKEISLRGKTITVRTSPVKFIRLTGKRGFARFEMAEKGKLIEKAEFDIDNIPDDPEFLRLLRLEIEDEVNLRAWSNTLFTV